MSELYSALDADGRWWRPSRMSGANDRRKGGREEDLCVWMSWVGELAKLNSLQSSLASFRQA